jgi:trimeric autotransporter adhesin
MNTMRKIYFSAALAILGCGNLHAQFGMDFSFSFGDGATADAYGFAHGAYTQAAANAFAFGDYAYAGYGAYGTGIAIGYDAEAYGGSYEAGIAIGGWSEAQPGSAAFGFNAYAGDYSVAVGSSTIASGTYSAAFGRSAQAIGPRSIAAGAFSYAPSFGGIALGFGNKAKRKDNSTPSATAQANDPVLMVGNAPSNWNYSDATRSNVLTVYRDGDAHFAGKVRVQPGGDISMGGYTTKPSGVVYP